MTIDHISFNVPASSYDKVVTWYLATLAPLSYTKQHDIPGKACGLGPSPDKAKFWIGASDSDQATTSGIHIAFTAQDHDTVIRCYGEGIKAGGVPNGDPGLREMYHPNYFAAFVFDPVG
jgi:4-hydroxyphenylpyruvate dioxygenase-like putative hemolysin